MRPVILEGGDWGRPPPFLPPFSTPGRPAAAVAPSGNFLAKKCFCEKKILGGVTHPFLHPLPAPPGGLRSQWPLQEIFWRKLFFSDKFFFGGGDRDPPLPPPPSSTPWRPAAAVAPSGPLRGTPFGRALRARPAGMPGRAAERSGSTDRQTKLGKYMYYFCTKCMMVSN